MAEYMLSTVDNPYNPFLDFKAWLQWDEVAGYYTTGLLARVIQTSPDLSEADEEDAIDKAIDEVVQENVYGVHIKVTAADEAPRRVTVDAERISGPAESRQAANSTRTMRNR